MVRGFNGQIGNKPIFDDSSDGSFIRQSKNSFVMDKSTNQKGTIVSNDKISEYSEEDDTTAKFTR